MGISDVKTVFYHSQTRLIPVLRLLTDGDFSSPSSDPYQYSGCRQQAKPPSTALPRAHRWYYKASTTQFRDLYHQFVICSFSKRTVLKHGRTCLLSVLLHQITYANASRSLDAVEFELTLPWKVILPFFKVLLGHKLLKNHKTFCQIQHLENF